jgi:hypothetical protein
MSDSEDGTSTTQKFEFLHLRSLTFRYITHPICLVIDRQVNHLIQAVMLLKGPSRSEQTAFALDEEPLELDFRDAGSYSGIQPCE